MCGLTGYIDLHDNQLVERAILAEMTMVIKHRGPDSVGYFTEGSVGFGFRRLSIVDLAGGDQPIYNEDKSLVLICNGEIYNYLILRKQLIQKGHTFRTNSDVEVLLHLYEEGGTAFLNTLNGQFAFAIYDRSRKRLFLARDHFGVAPLYYTISDNVLIFGSEIKAILAHPLVSPAVDLTGLDQIFSFPGLVSPTTMFKHIKSLPHGHTLTVENGEVKVAEYWDLDYPQEEAGEKPGGPHPDDYYINTLSDLFAQSVRYRLQGDVPVHFYLSGGLDSSLIGAMIKHVSPQVTRHAFSIRFPAGEGDELKYQKIVADMVTAHTHEIHFNWATVADRLPNMIYHAECPVKETYNVCFLALSEAVHKQGYKVILTGEGADELFAGYVGYRFDSIGAQRGNQHDLNALMEEEIRETLWGDKNLFYEKNQYAFREIKQAIYADALNEQFDTFDCVHHTHLNHTRLQGRHPIHKRSYLDFKLRMSDHLLMDHGDRMALANSVEARYPFLDLDLIEFAKTLPPHLKLRGLTEKYILRQIASPLLPPEITQREKFGWFSAGSPVLLQQNVEWAHDLLSYERIKRQGYFNPDTIEYLKEEYAQPGFTLNLPFESDLLIIVLTFGLFLDAFKLPNAT